jgi:membrane protein
MRKGFVRYFRSVQRLEIHIYAAYAAYFWILAVFPAVMLIISILQYTPIAPADLQGLLERVVPVSLQSLTDYMIDELFAVNSPAILSISAAAALWMISKGMLSLVRGLNRVYTARETRNPLRLRLRCLLFALAGVLVMILILALQFVSRDVIGLLLAEGNALGDLLLGIARLKRVLTVVTLTVIFTVTYSVFPNRPVSVGASLPGAFTAAVLWVLFSQLFTLYVENFGNYSLYYGSLSVIAMTMLWLYVCIFLFFCGAVLNRQLERWRGNKRI